MLTPNAPPEADLARFRGDLAKCGCADATIGVCVSGGPDSLALLLLAHAACPSIKAATVDHRLRSTSAAEAHFVGSICAQLGVPHVILSLGSPAPGNRSASARAARYEALRDWARSQTIALLMTAHHADDQLETIVMRLNRGSGVAGLAGVRTRHSDLCRPLLGWRKADLEAVVAACGITPVDDPTNVDDGYDRARLRKQLAKIDWLNPISAATSAAALADANDALEWAAQRMVDERLQSAGDFLSITLDDVPHELVRRVALACLKRINPQASPRGDALDRLIATLQLGQPATLGGVKCKGGAVWTFSAAAPRRAN